MRGGQPILWFSHTPKLKPYERFGVKRELMKKSDAVGRAAVVSVLTGCCTINKSAHREHNTETQYLSADLDPNELDQAEKNAGNLFPAQPFPAIQMDALLWYSSAGRILNPSPVRGYDV
jgi:hypothetical protein